MKKIDPISVIAKNEISVQYQYYILFLSSMEMLGVVLPEFLIIFSDFILKYVEKNDIKNGIAHIPLVINDNYVYITICFVKDFHANIWYENIKNMIGESVSFMQNNQLVKGCIIFDSVLQGRDDFAKIVEAVQVAYVLKLYLFDKYLSEKLKNKNSTVVLFLLVDDNVLWQKAIDRGNIIGNAINFSRYLSDLPAKDLYPESFVTRVLTYLDSFYLNYKSRVIEGQELESLQMGGICGVGAGSSQKPRLLLLEYDPIQKTHDQKSIALVGKGVTFDTGGISIKPADGMEDMKSDMSGAAAVCAAFAALTLLQSSHKIIVAVPLAENMVSGSAIRPGDILKFYNGKTAEVKNTDAEGRLVLADALAYVSDIYKPDFMIDLATLTGACRIALGPLYAGLMTENQELQEKIISAGKVSGDKCWPLPLEDGYVPNMMSHVADMCNIGTKGYKAGATMGGMFLREFVGAGICWAHIDIAPVATDCPYKKYIHSFGATGFGVYLLVELCG